MKSIFIVLIFCCLLFSSFADKKCFPRVFEFDSKTYMIMGNMTETNYRLIQDLNSKKEYSILQSINPITKEVETIISVLRHDLKKGYFLEVESKRCHVSEISEDVRKKKNKKKIKFKKKRWI
jgi:prephenate dehydrogenase